MCFSNGGQLTVQILWITWITAFCLISPQLIQGFFFFFTGQQKFKRSWKKVKSIKLQQEAPNLFIFINRLIKNLIVSGVVVEGLEIKYVSFSLVALILYLHREFSLLDLRSSGCMFATRHLLKVFNI